MRRGHRIMKVQGRYKCSIYLKSGVSIPSLLNKRCPGQIGVKQHVIKQVAGFSYCGRCNAYSSKRMQRLGMTCKPRDKVKVEITRLRASLHPISGMPLEAQFGGCTAKARRRIMGKQTPHNCSCALCLLRRNRGSWLG